MPPATPATCRSVTLRRRRPRSFISSRVTRGPDGGGVPGPGCSVEGLALSMPQLSSAGTPRTIGDSPDPRPGPTGVRVRVGSGSVLMVGGLRA